MRTRVRREDAVRHSQCAPGLANQSGVGTHGEGSESARRAVLSFPAARPKALVINSCPNSNISFR